MAELRRPARTLAIVPARAGSKGLPNKNILPCAGKPLIQWTIEAARKARTISEVMGSTDSPEIQQVVQQVGGLAPFLREASLSSDDASVVDVVRDALVRCEQDFGKFDVVVLLQPTSPLRKAEHIDEAVELFLNKRVDDLDTLVSVSEVEQKILWAQGISADGRLYSHFGIDLSKSRRQQLPNCYLPNGAIYVASTADFLSFYGKRIIPYVMSVSDSIDIDYQNDFDEAESLLSNRKLNL